MSSTITGHEYPLSKIFSPDFEFHIPPYQRPYAWTETEASALIEDLYRSYQETPQEDYFLGSIVLIKEENVPRADVIDGQQRLTSLCILLAAIANQTLDRKVKQEFLDYIMEEGKITRGLPAKPRLTLRDKDNHFFRKYIQELNFNSLFVLQKDQIQTEAQGHILKNAKLYDSRLRDLFNQSQEKVIAFGSYVIQHCYLVAVSSPSKKSAFRVFSILNNRGLDLLPSDIIKADIIGSIEESKQDDYTEKWETIENQTGRDKFNELFGHIRMIFSRRKQQKSLLDEFKTYVLDSKMDSEKFIETILNPYAEAYRILTMCAYVSENNASKINFYLKWLNKIDNTDWLPPAILFLSKHYSHDKIELFIKKLERLAASMHICAENVNYRIDRYASIIEDISKNEESVPPSIELKKSEIQKMLDRLNGSIYSDLTGVRRNYLILRLDSFVSDGTAQYSPATLTIEHVLPQNPDKSSQWIQWWQDEEERNIWVHKIANLVPLSRQKNSAAQNYEFDRKKREYFTGRNGTSSYALTTQVLNTTEWTPAILEKRQKDLINVFVKNWELNLELAPDFSDDSDNSDMGQRGSFVFSDYGIPLGAELSYTRDTSIKCVVVDDNKVVYRDQKYTLSGLAKKLLKDINGMEWKSARGILFFSYKGMRLADMVSPNS